MQPTVGLRTSNTALPPQTIDTSAASDAAAMQPVAVADVGLPAQPAALKPGHFDFAMQHGNATHAKFLDNCLARDPTTRVVSVELDEGFWSWIKNADTSVIIRAYLDAGRLSNQQSTAAADYKGLFTQSGAAADLGFTQEQLDQLDAERNFAFSKLEAYHDSRAGKACPSLFGAPRALKAEYAAGTKNIDDKGANFSADYGVFKRGAAFANELKAFSQKESFEAKNSALLKRIAKDKKFLFTLAATIKRLEMTHNTGASQQA